MGGGAWPFLVRGLICLVDSVNERDLNLLKLVRPLINPYLFWACLRQTIGGFYDFLEGLSMSNRLKSKAITGL